MGQLQKLLEALDKVDRVHVEIEKQILKLEQERDMLQALAQSAINYIDKSPCNPNMYEEQFKAWNKYKDTIHACQDAGVLPFPVEK